MARKYSVVSLFSGGMGLDLGLERTGRFETRACVEKTPAFCETIKRNRDAGRLACRDLRIYQIDINRLDPVKLMKDTGLYPGSLDLLVGGPPCQSFSTAGRRGTVRDPRGTLLWRFLYFVTMLKPKFFLMENVRGLMSAALKHRPIIQRPERGGSVLEPNERPGSVVKQFLGDLDSNYRVDYFEVNAVNYGAPQLRERVLFIGNQYNHLVEFPAPTHGQHIPLTTLGEALKGLHETDPLILDFSLRKKHYLALIPPGGNWRCLSSELAKESMGKAYFSGGGRSGWWRRLSFDLPCPTILTMPNHAGTSLCYPTEVRALTLRECARVQEFPDEWEFCGRVSEQYAQVGNAVPLRLGRIAGEILIPHLDRVYRERFVPDQGSYPIYRHVYLGSHVRTR